MHRPDYFLRKNFIFGRNIQSSERSIFSLFYFWSFLSYVCESMEVADFRKWGVKVARKPVIHNTTLDAPFFIQYTRFSVKNETELRVPRSSQLDTTVT